MNSRAKGRRNELKTKEWLEERGWHVYLVPSGRIFNRDVDMFGLWDIVAHRGQELMWVQVKSNRKPTRKYIEKLAAFDGPGWKSLWIWVDRKMEPEIIDLG